MAKPLEKPVDTLHDSDFFAWTQEQARRLRARSHNDIDWDNLAEEIESVGRSDWYEIESRMEVLLLHLLKWSVQREARSSGWRGTIVEQRIRIARRIKHSPSLKSYPAEVLEDAYRVARAGAATETGLELNVFPEGCPFTISQVLQAELDDLDAIEIRDGRS